MLSERRDLAAARRFFKRAISTNGVPDRIVIDKSGASLAGLQAVNVSLKFTGCGRTTEIRQVKYLTNILEQDHRIIKRITAPMMGSKAFHAAATISKPIACRLSRSLPGSQRNFIIISGQSDLQKGWRQNRLRNIVIMDGRLAL